MKCIVIYPILYSGYICLCSCSANPTQSFMSDLNKNGKSDKIRIVESIKYEGAIKQYPFARYPIVSRLSYSTKSYTYHYDIFIQCDSNTEMFLLTLNSVKKTRFTLRDYNNDGNVDICTLRNAEDRKAERESHYVDSTIYGSGNGTFYWLDGGKKCDIPLRDKKPEEKPVSNVSMPISMMTPSK